MTHSLRVHAVVLAVHRARLGGDASRSPGRTFSMSQPMLLEHGLRSRSTSSVDRRVERLRHGLGGERRIASQSNSASGAAAFVIMDASSGLRRSEHEPPRSADRRRSRPPRPRGGDSPPRRPRPRAPGREGRRGSRAPLASSRLPVGSSASSSGGSFSTARQKATRCCSPPESCGGIVVQPAPARRTPARARAPAGAAPAAAPHVAGGQQHVVERGERRAAAGTTGRRSRRTGRAPGSWPTRPSALTRSSSNHTSPRVGVLQEPEHVQRACSCPSPTRPATADELAGRHGRGRRRPARGSARPAGARYAFTSPAAPQHQAPRRIASAGDSRDDAQRRVGGGRRAEQHGEHERAAEQPRREQEELLALRAAQPSTSQPRRSASAMPTRAARQRHRQRLAEHLAPELQIGGARAPA